MCSILQTGVPGGPLHLSWSYMGDFAILIAEGGLTVSVPVAPDVPVPRPVCDRPDGLLPLEAQGQRVPLNHTSSGNAQEPVHGFTLLEFFIVCDFLSAWT